MFSQSWYLVLLFSLLNVSYYTIFIFQPVFPNEVGALIVTASTDGRAVSQRSQGSSPIVRNNENEVLPTVPPPQPLAVELSRISEDSTRNEKQSCNVPSIPQVLYLLMLGNNLLK